MTMRGRPLNISERHVAQRRAGKITLYQLAVLYGVSLSRMWKELRRRGLTGRPRKPLRISKRHLAQRRAGKITLRELAALYGVSVSYMWKELKRRGLPGPARQKTILISKRHLAQRRAGMITLRELAALHGVSKRTIWKELKRLGVSRVEPRVDRQKYQTVLQLAGQGWTGPQIAAHLGISRQRVHQILAANVGPRAPAT
jgi:predicted HTH domain antitoxin